MLQECGNTTTVVADSRESLENLRNLQAAILCSGCGDKVDAVAAEQHHVTYCDKPIDIKNTDRSFLHW